MLSNPFFSPEDAEKQYSRMPKPDVMNRLSRKRWVTNEEAELHYISKCLGQLHKDGFVFAYSLDNGFLTWPVEYLDSVLAHYAAECLQREIWAYQFYQGKKPPVVMSNAQQEAARSGSLELSKGLANLETNKQLVDAILAQYTLK